MNNLKEHPNNNTSKNEIYKCVQCKKEFSEEWKMSAHLKMHKKYDCEQCEKTFEYLDIKTKLVQVFHEKGKFYCHY